MAGPVLAYACGRSYGDSCLNDGGTLLDVRRLDRLIAFDEAAGLLRCEAGVTLAEILDVVVPRGWFLPVVPGTRWVSVGGAIANDIHGKNHHRAGTFGCHVTCLELARSSGERIVCTPDEPLFQATVGGLGLTGLILWAELRLKRVPGAGITQEKIRFPSLEGFFDLAADDPAHEYTVAWVDCLARGSRLGRGVYLRGDHAPLDVPAASPLDPTRLRVPLEAPAGLINRLTICECSTRPTIGVSSAGGSGRSPLRSFFFPLDVVGDWTRLYGPRGSCGTSASSSTRRPAARSGPSSSASAARTSPRAWACLSASGRPDRPDGCRFHDRGSPWRSTFHSGGATWRCSTSSTPWCATRTVPSTRPRMRA